MTITASSSTAAAAPPSSNSINNSSSAVVPDKLKRDKLKRTRDEAGFSLDNKPLSGSGSIKVPVLDLSVKQPSSDGGAAAGSSSSKKLLPNGSASGGGGGSHARMPDFMDKGSKDKNGKSATTTECSVTLDKSKIDASVRLSSQVNNLSTIL